MSRIWLIRHGAYEMIGHGLGGRAPYPLDETGRLQAGRIAAHLASCPIRAVLSSPVRRARQTAEPLADRLGLTVRLEPDLTEIDFAAWTGRDFATLAGEPAWRDWNAARGTAAVPGGEAMGAVQARAVGALRRLAEASEDEAAVFSHGDVIKAALAHILGAPLDLLGRLEIAPGSISGIELHRDDARVLCVNLTP